MPAFNLNIDISKEKSEGVERSLNNLLEWVLSYGRYIIIGTQIIVLIAFFSRFQLDQQLSDLRSKITEKMNILNILTPVEKEIRLLQARLAVLKSLEASRTIYTTVISDLSEHTSGVAISNLSITENKLSLAGSSAGGYEFSRFLEHIRTSPFYSQISLDEITQNDTDGSFAFIISSDIKSSESLTEVKNTGSPTQESVNL